MKLDELTRELRAQADEAMTGAPVRMADLRTRRTRQRRRAATVAGAATAVVLVLGAAAWSGGPGTGSQQLHPADQTTTPPAPSSPAPTPPAPSSPAPAPSAAATSWTALRCNPPEWGGCDVPLTLRHRGRTYTNIGGSSGMLPLHGPDGFDPDRVLSLPLHDNTVMVLVGASGAGPESQIAVSIGDRPARQLSADGLELLPVSQARGGGEVVVRENGVPAKGERLHIATYRSDR